MIVYIFINISSVFLIVFLEHGQAIIHLIPHGVSVHTQLHQSVVVGVDDAQQRHQFKLVLLLYITLYQLYHTLKQYLFALCFQEYVLI